MPSTLVWTGCGRLILKRVRQREERGGVGRIEILWVFYLEEL